MHILTLFPKGPARAWGGGGGSTRDDGGKTAGGSGGTSTGGTNGSAGPGSSAGSADSKGDNNSGGSGNGGYVRGVDLSDSPRPPDTRGSGVSNGTLSGHDLVRGDGMGYTREVGVSTNFAGNPTYDSSEVGDGQGGYETYYDENPNSTLSPSQATVQRSIARLSSVLGLAPIALGTQAVTRLQEAGLMPRGIRVSGTSGGSSGATSGDGSDSDLDSAVNEILDNEDLSEDEKASALSTLFTHAASTEANEARATSFTDYVGNLADQTYTGTSPQDFAADPYAFLSGDTRLQDQMPWLDANAEGTTIDPNDPRFQYNPGQFSYDPTLVGQAAQAGAVTPGQAVGYNPALSYGQVAQYGQGTAAQGQVSGNAMVNAEQSDMQGAATGVNADGSTNYLGQALNSAAQQGISTVIDTSTVAGRMLADQLGEGNYTDAKATVQGQMEILSREFVDAAGNPKIPTWAAGTARAVSRIAAFSGMTGTAATAAMSQAIMEASLPIAQQDAQFFQTVTLENLSNRQQSTINKAQVLARLDLANLDARTQAAVTNAQSFLQMDLANLSNRQQMEIINTQSRVQSLLEDTKQQNAARMFEAESTNDFTKFYDQLATQIDQFNVNQTNSMAQFDATQVNSAAQFNSQLEASREQFYSEMAYNISLANTRWRQTVETTNNQNHFQAAQTDVQNLFDISTEAMTRMWDREDALLDYAWRSSETEWERQVSIYQADRGYDLDERRLNNEEDAATGASWWEFGKTVYDVGGKIGWW